MSAAEKSTAMNAADALVGFGDLREELLPLMWEPVGLHDDDYGPVLLMLCASGVLFLAEHTQQGRKWVMPMRLPDVQSNEAKQAWALVCGEADSEVLAIRMKLGTFAPPGIVERLMSSATASARTTSFGSAAR